MEEEALDEKLSTSVLSRYRGPTFSKSEVEALLNIIDRHKYTILNKSTNSTANQAKEISWEKITKAFNSRGFKHERSVDSLKTKWENLKKETRKLSKNLMDIDNAGYNDLTRHIMTMMADVENNTALDPAQDIDEEFNESLENDDTNNSSKRKSFWDSCDEEDSNDGDDGKRTNRSLNFAPQECTLLLECVRKEKKHVFSKECNAQAIELKNNAWKRITHSFNMKSPQKRHQKVLKTKFNNMKNVAKNMTLKEIHRNLGLKSAKHEKLINDTTKKIKSEPVFELDLELEQNDDDGENDHHNSDSSHNHLAPDPLSTVVNSDSGIGSIHSNSCCQENKEIVKLKKDLLNYQMETAMLERKRVEKAMQAEAAAQESNLIETSLRLRSARLEAVAAAMKLPSSHPALLYTTEETPAQSYLQRYEQT